MNKRKLEKTYDEDQSEKNSAKKSKKLPKFFDGTYYELIDYDGQSVNVQAKCNECKRTIKGSITSTGNFYKHYRLSHQDVFQSIKEYCEKSENKPAFPKKNQPTLLPFVNMLDQDKVNVHMIHYNNLYFFHRINI